MVKRPLLSCALAFLSFQSCIFFKKIWIHKKRREQTGFCSVYTNITTNKVKKTLKGLGIFSIFSHVLCTFFPLFFLYFLAMLCWACWTWLDPSPLSHFIFLFSFSSFLIVFFTFLFLVRLGFSFSPPLLFFCLNLFLLSFLLLKAWLGPSSFFFSPFLFSFLLFLFSIWFQFDKKSNVISILDNLNILVKWMPKAKSNCPCARKTYVDFLIATSRVG